MHSAARWQAVSTAQPQRFIATEAVQPHAPASAVAAVDRVVVFAGQHCTLWPVTRSGGQVWQVLWRPVVTVQPHAPRVVSAAQADSAWQGQVVCAAAPQSAGRSCAATTPP